MSAKGEVYDDGGGWEDGGGGWEGFSAAWGSGSGDEELEKKRVRDDGFDWNLR